MEVKRVNKYEEIWVLSKTICASARKYYLFFFELSSEIYSVIVIGFVYKTLILALQKKSVSLYNI